MSRLSLSRTIGFMLAYHSAEVAASVLLEAYATRSTQNKPCQDIRMQLAGFACRTRELSVRRKLNAMPAVFEGKNVLLVDDSIVRGTTMSQIVEMVSSSVSSTHVSRSPRLPAPTPGIHKQSHQVYVPD